MSGVEYWSDFSAEMGLDKPLLVPEVEVKSELVSVSPTRIHPWLAMFRLADNAIPHACSREIVPVGISVSPSTLSNTHARRPLALRRRSSMELRADSRPARVFEPGHRRQVGEATPEKRPSEVGCVTRPGTPGRKCRSASV
jgi:hypothetical protein